MQLYNLGQGRTRHIGVMAGPAGGPPGSSLGEKMAVIREAAGDRYDSIARETLRNMVDGLGWKATTLGSGEAAVKYVQARPGSPGPAEVLLLDRWGGRRALPRMGKSEVADAILSHALGLRAATPASVPR